MTPTISDPTLFVRAYNIRPRQCQTPRFSRETTISGPEHDTYNLRPHAFRVRLQYQAPTMSVVTFLAQHYNIRPRTWHLQSQTPRFSCELTISGPDNVWPHAFHATLQYQAPNRTPTILDPVLFVREYNDNHKPSNLRQRFIFWAIFQPRTFMSRHTSCLKGFIYQITLRPWSMVHLSPHRRWNTVTVVNKNATISFQ